MKCLDLDAICIWNATRSPFCCSGFCLQYENEPEGHCDILPTTTTTTTSPKPSPMLQNKESLTMIIISVSISVVILLALVLAIIYFRRLSHTVFVLSLREVKEFKYGVKNYEKKNQQEYTEIEMTTDSDYNPNIYTTLQENAPYNTTFELPEKDLKIESDNILGFGEYGLVYSGQYKNDTKVAIKTLKDNLEKRQVKSLLEEIKVLIHLHQNDYIVNIIGAQTKEIRKGKVNLVIEFCPLGSVKSFMKKAHFIELPDSLEANSNFQNMHQFQGESYETKDLFIWAYQISQGMEFLKSKRVIHGDLATRNVLLQSKSNVKISDFGLSRKIYDYSEYCKKSQEPLPFRWMALESLKNLSFTYQSDVWSYGVTIWEIFTLGNLPYPEFTWNLDFITLLEENQYRLSKPKYLPENLYNNVLKKCWLNDPTERPSIEIIKEILAKYTT